MDLLNFIYITIYCVAGEHANLMESQIMVFKCMQALALLSPTTIYLYSFLVYLLTFPC